MIRFNRACVCAAMTLACVCGCADQEAQNRQALRQQFLQAVSLLEDAERGYGDNKTTDARNYRLKQLDVAVKQLEPLATQGPNDQQITVRRLIATAQLAQARAMTRQATTDWTSLAGESGTLIGQVVSLSKADGRAKLFTPNETDLIQSLRQFQSKTEEQLKASKSLQQQLQTSIDQLAGERNLRIKDRDTAAVQAQKLRSEGFTKTSKDQFDLIQKALEADGRAQAADAKAEQLQARISIMQAELAIALQQDQHSTNALQLIAEQLKSAQERTQAAEQLRDKALKDDKDPASKQIQTQRLIESFDNLVKAYTSKVEASFIQAIQLADKAIASLEQAEKISTTDAILRKQVSIELLAAYSAKVQLLTRLVTAKGSLGQALAVVAERAAANELLPEKSTYFSESAKRIRESQNQTIADAKQVIQQATDLAGKLQTSGGPSQDQTLAFATAQTQQLTACAARLDEGKIPDKIVLPAIKP